MPPASFFTLHFRQNNKSLKMIKLTIVFILGFFVCLVLYVVNNSPATLLIDIVGPVEFALMVIQIIWEMLLARARII